MTGQRTTVIFLGLLSVFTQALSQESCYGAGQHSVQAGIYSGAGRWFGTVASYEYGVHDLVSVGGSVGFSWWIERYGWGYSSDYYYSYMEFPFAVRAMFHPFNLPVLAERVRIRDRLDVYGGLITGWAPYTARWHEPSDTPHPNRRNASRGGYILSGVFGARFYLTPSFGFYAEESAGAFGWFNGGVVLKF